MKLFGFCLIVLVKSVFAVASEDTLEFIHVLYRHGARTPVHFCASDPYSDLKYWPEGLGQLTKKGIAMEYKLGAWLRKRYAKFIDEEFHNDQAYIRTTDYSRTIMSADAVMGSFYYPSMDIRFNKSIPWMPTPAHSTARKDDQLIDVDASCPRVPLEMIKANHTHSIMKYVDDHKELFEIISENCQDDRRTILRVAFLFDSLFVEKNHGLKLPDWVGPYYDQMKEVAAFSFLINTYTPELKRLRAGPLIEQFSRNMNRKAIDEMGHEKMYMYSAHDSTVAILLDSLGAYNGIAPPYAATILLELHKIDEQYIVKMFYRNDTNIEMDPYPIAVAGCEHACPLKKWTALVSPLIPSDWKAECYIRDPVKDALLINILSGLLLVVLLMVIFWLCQFAVGRCTLKWIQERRSMSPYVAIISTDEPHPCYGAV